MASLTLAVDDELLHRAQLRALEQGTSVDSLVQRYLETYSGVTGNLQNAVDELLRLSREAESRRGDRSWSREELHER